MVRLFCVPIFIFIRGFSSFFIIKTVEMSERSVQKLVRKQNLDHISRMGKYELHNLLAHFALY